MGEVSVIHTGVITAETPMTSEEFERLKSFFVAIRNGQGTSDGALTRKANELLEYTKELAAKYQLPLTGGRYYVQLIDSSQYFQWWSDSQLMTMGYEPAIGGS